MALHLPLHFPITSQPHPQFKKLNRPTPNLHLLKPLTAPKTTKPNLFAVRATPTEEEDIPTKIDDVSDIGSELKKAMEEREREREGMREKGFWGGVLEEVGEIEWPAFVKVVGTTGVVLGVIAGSSVVLLTVNAVLAEISDRVFAGRGVQDFFG